MIKENITTREIHRDDRWLVLKPLSFEASLKYGSSTKWCTSSKKNPLHFYEYSNEGILIYIIERKSNVKWAVYWEMIGGVKIEMSWWNSEDKRIDSIQTSIPEYIMGIVRRELFTESKTNYHYLSESEIRKHEDLILEVEESVTSEGYLNSGFWPTHTTNTFYSSDDTVRGEMYHRVMSTTMTNYLKGDIVLSD
tara:strand:- start:1484 stop:2065 length:582 start_codon:yes stop_codon:yes gene_type:complete